jgi:HTH-type transcriptional regulator/antitoxin HigA
MKADPGTPEADELEVLTILAHRYEEENFPIAVPDPIAAIKYRKSEQGLEDKDLVPFLGERSRVSEVLNRKRKLTLPMIRELHKGLKIPLSCLVQDYELEK